MSILLSLIAASAIFGKTYSNCSATAHISFAIVETSGTIQSNSDAAVNFSSVFLRKVWELNGRSLQNGAKIDIDVYKVGNGRWVRWLVAKESLKAAIEDLRGILNYGKQRPSSENCRSDWCLHHAITSAVDRRKNRKIIREEEKALVIFTDGAPEDPKLQTKVIAEASHAMRQSFTIYTIILGYSPTSSAFLRDHVATTTNYSYTLGRFGDSTDYEAIFDEILDDICKESGPKMVRQEGMKESRGTDAPWWLIDFMIGVFSILGVVGFLVAIQAAIRNMQKGDQKQSGAKAKKRS